MHSKLVERRITVSTAVIDQLEHACGFEELLEFALIERRLAERGDVDEKHGARTRGKLHQAELSMAAKVDALEVDRDGLRFLDHGSNARSAIVEVVDDDDGASRLLSLQATGRPTPMQDLT